MQHGTGDNIVERIFQEHHALVDHLVGAGEISLRNDVDRNFRKTLVLSAASYFEIALSDSLVALFSARTGSAEPLVEFVRNKAVARQYHDFFDWSSRNGNRFFRLFGENFRQFMVAEVNSDSDLDSSIRAFLELGQLRNQLVHQNFAVFPLDKTVEEIYVLYLEALRFVEAFPNKVIDYIDRFPISAES